jgi:histidyl-tRNA synthetase
LTVPLARVVANSHAKLAKFFKRYQIQPVWRADRPARGRFREFYQCDVDAIGSSSMVVEAELISAVSEILMRLGFEDFVVRLNHRKLLSGILSIWVPDEKTHVAALIAIDKLDKIGSEGVLSELREIGLAEKDAEGLLDIFDLTNMQISAMTRDPHIHRTILEMLDERIGKDSDVGRAGIADLRGLAELLSLQSDKFDWRIDPSLARGLSYYTGTIMEVNVPDLAGSLGGGGRYDGLIGMFGKEQIPACGFSLGLERILVVMEERGMFPSEIADSTPADVMVTIWSDETVAESLKLANELRSQNLRVTVYPEADKLGKQLKYADSINVPFVCVLGESEIAENKVTVKNMKTGEQQPYQRDEIASKIAK